jgi:antitoxin component YwqK of YwqJK toxin-antitoxin module
LYYENGKLKGKWKYKNGTRDGKTIRYYENGEIRYINTYTKGELIQRKEYDEKGNLNLERDYPIKDKGEK